MSLQNLDTHEFLHNRKNLIHNCDPTSNPDTITMAKHRANAESIDKCNQN